ncbi:unnamed protein product [Prorocentrum cordatum]|uniref:Uncharacterized protein n=1 Tax=Prorocentrum cordatum TaxID=2364126 RepID=A0ABN9TQR9_9DINO|nr:unnamed protein product [Polarella glacialis]
MCMSDDKCCSGSCVGGGSLIPGQVLGRCVDGTGLAQTDQSQGVATKGGDTDQEQGGCKSNGDMCMSDDKCCSGSCVGGGSLIPGQVLGRCVDGTGLAQTDPSQGVATKGGDTDQEQGGCKSNGDMCMSGDKCCSGSCVGGGSLIPGQVLGRCADGVSLAQTDQSQGDATEGGDSDREEGGCMSNGDFRSGGDQCCSGSCVCASMIMKVCS